MHGHVNVKLVNTYLCTCKYNYVEGDINNIQQLNYQHRSQLPFSETLADI